MEMVSLLSLHRVIQGGKPGETAYDLSRACPLPGFAVLCVLVGARKVRWPSPSPSGPLPTEAAGTADVARSLWDWLGPALGVGAVFSILCGLALRQIEAKRQAFEAGQVSKAKEKSEAAFRRNYLAMREVQVRYDPRATAVAVRVPAPLPDDVPGLVQPASGLLLAKTANPLPARGVAGPAQGPPLVLRADANTPHPAAKAAAPASLLHSRG